MHCFIHQRMNIPIETVTRELETKQRGFKKDGRNNRRWPACGSTNRACLIDCHSEKQMTGQLHPLVRQTQLSIVEAYYFITLSFLDTSAISM